MKNYVLVVSVQRETEIEALVTAHRVATTIAATVECRESGTNRKFALVDTDGNILLPPLPK